MTKPWMKGDCPIRYLAEPFTCCAQEFWRITSSRGFQNVVSVIPALDHLEIRKFGSSVIDRWPKRTPFPQEASQWCEGTVFPEVVS